jgi:hypothetical protein
MTYSLMALLEMMFSTSFTAIPMQACTGRATNPC